MVKERSFVNTNSSSVSVNKTIRGDRSPSVTRSSKPTVRKWLGNSHTQVEKEESGVSISTSIK